MNSLSNSMKSSNPLPWRDEAAITVMTTTLRMKLLKTLEIGYNSVLLRKVRHLFAWWEIDLMCSKQTRFARAKLFIDILTSKMTTSTFMTFINALDNAILHSELLQAYVEECNCVTKT